MLDLNLVNAESPIQKGLQSFKGITRPTPLSLVRLEQWDKSHALYLRYLRVPSLSTDLQINTFSVKGRVIYGV